MAKIEDDEICPCGSGQSFGQCHGKKIRERSVPQITQHIRLDVIPEPDSNSRSVFQKMPGTGTVVFQGYESTESLDCGSCGAPLAVGIRPGLISSVVLQCAACRAFNELSGTQNSTEPDLGAINQPLENAETMSKGNKVYEERVVFLTELIDKRERPPKLEDFTFTSCQIRGPVVVYPVESSFSGCRFQNDIDSMLYEVPEGSVKVGIVGLIRCTFRDCDIEALGIAGTPAGLDQMRAAFGTAGQA
jgi:SEC-C motif-containing protein